MKARRTITVAALAALACLLPAAAAHAQVKASVASPEPGHVATGPVEIRATATFEFGDARPERAYARLVGADGAVVPGTDVITLPCVNRCGPLQGQPVVFKAADDFEPATLAPFGDTVSCNGAYGVQAQADGMGNRWSSANGMVVQLPPSAPTGVEVTTRPGQATVTWTAPPQPDLTGFAVERRAGGGWTRVAEPGAGTTSVTDRNAPSGEVEYRVLAFRGDGMGNDGPVAACEDTGRDLSTTSSVTSATVPKPPPSPSPTDTGPGGTATPSDGASDGTGQPGDGTEQPTETATGGDAGRTDSDPTPTPSSERVAPPESVATSSRPEVDVPDVATDEASETESESFYGDDLGFSEEIDYGDLGTVQATGETQRTVTVRVPGALQGLFGETLALQRVMTPVAGGMILLSFGLHLRRWARQGLHA